MCCTWIFTVVSAIASVRAISLLLAPSAICSSTCCSRAESWAKGSGAGCAAAAGAVEVWNAETSLPVISELITGSPRIAR